VRDTNSTSERIYSELAKLSAQKQWILYTANCPRPVQAELVKHDINCKNVIHMKPSNLYSEEEIVIKAVNAGTASAIVASAGLSAHSIARIKEVAGLRGCAVFFLNQSPQPNHMHH
jgi:cell division inhibitor SulA